MRLYWAILSILAGMVLARCIQVVTGQGVTVVITWVLLSVLIYIGLTQEK